jgi:hypothetical protein
MRNVTASVSATEVIVIVLLLAFSPVWWVV